MGNVDVNDMPEIHVNAGEGVAEVQLRVHLGTTTIPGPVVPLDDYLATWPPCSAGDRMAWRMAMPPAMRNWYDGMPTALKNGYWLAERMFVERVQAVRWPAP